MHYDSTYVICTIKNWILFNFKTVIFLTFSVQSDTYINTDCVSDILCKSFEGGPSYDNYQPMV